jgi:hypothetical protein
MLITLLTGVESLINSKTPVSDDINDLEALTSSHFLIGRVNLNLAPTTIYNKDKEEKKRWKKVQAMTNQFF